MLDRCYPIARRALFALEPERAHAAALGSLNAAHRLGLLGDSPPARSSPATLMGLAFANRIGLAAGFDKNASCIDALGALGFGFLEIGTVTPRPQPGQRLPRLFRLPEAQALINRMGFPNQGARALAERVARRRYRGILGINIGKNADTPLEHAVRDYLECFRVLAPHADYVAVNVSSPNTPELRRLQEAGQLEPILDALLDARERMAGSTYRRVPLLVKISPDASDEDIAMLGSRVAAAGIDGVIATNTTLSRPAQLASRSLEGGLSGQPLRPLALRAVRALRTALDARIAIVAVGGIASAGDAAEAMRAGADLLQIYTGLIYRGPGLVRELLAEPPAREDR